MIRAWVQTHPFRVELAQERLLPGLAGLEPELVIDDGPLPPNPWRGYQACLHSFIDSESEWGLIVQDDAVPCRNLARTLERIVERHPHNVICLFVGGGALGSYVLDHKLRYSKLANGWYVPVVATLWPRAQALALLEWEQTAPKKIVPNDRSDDGYVGLWRKRTGAEVLVTYPCLFQHPDDQPAVIIKDKRRAQARAGAGMDRRRVACEFIGHRDPLELDW